MPPTLSESDRYVEEREITLHSALSLSTHSNFDRYSRLKRVTASMKRFVQELSKSRATEIPKPHAHNKGALRSRTALDWCHSTTAFLRRNQSTKGAVNGM